MRSSIRVLRRIAFLTAVGVVQLTGCVGDSPEGVEQPDKSGSVRLALQTAAPSGNVYRLRNAIFEITHMRSGSQVAFLFSEDDSSARELSTLLETGDYTVTLQPGWFLERVSGTGPIPDPLGGRGGASPAGGAPTGPVFGGAGGKSPRPPIELPIPDFGAAGAGGASEDEPPIAGRGGSGGSTGVAGGPVTAGTVGVGGSFPGPGPGTAVPAQLISDAVQFFSIFGGDDVFINYHFRVGDEIIDFSRGRVRIGISVDDEGVCVPPPGGLETSRVLFEHNEAALRGMSLGAVFTALTTNEGHDTSPVRLYQELIDTYATAAEAGIPDARHCDDETVDGVPTLNGYPITCNRRERFQLENIDRWFATAFVNRIDLAPQNGAHCGQQRVLFANPSQGRMFLIFENQIPNPSPELGLAGCMPLAEFWLAANDIPDPVARGERLQQAFLTGIPELQAFGFGPFLSPSNLTVGTGQIRSNNFDQDPWTLREFKLALDGTRLTMVPFPVDEAPNGALWDEASGLPQGAFCRENFIQAAQGLLSNNPAEMSFVVDQACKDAESRNDFSQAYAFQLSPGFRSQLDATFGPLGLSGEDIANRAHFAGSCMGCHVENNGSSLGNGVTSPFSLGFVHVAEFPSPCADGTCFPISSGLTNVFLPRRLRALTDLVGIEPPPNPCDGSGGEGTGGAGGTGGSSMGGKGGIAGFPGSGAFPGFPEGGAFDEGQGGDFGTAGSGADPEPTFPPAPVVEIELPQADVPVETLEERDAEIRSNYGERTLGGRDAQSTH